MMDQSRAEAKRVKNIEQGLPGRSYFPWAHEEKESLAERYKSGYSFEALASLFERKVSAIVGQLRKLDCISEAEFREYFPSLARENAEMEFNYHNVHALWHITHKDNVKSITERGILNHYMAHDMRDAPVDISDPDAQRWRDRVEPEYKRRLHEYVPLYINQKNPMLYVRRNIQSDLCLLRVSLDVLRNREFIFSDGNAASRDTKFFKSVSRLNNMPWDVIQADLWTGFPDGKRQRCSEVLVYPKIDYSHIESIHCYSADVAAYLSEYARNVEISRDLFF